jgi:lysophospholipase L1-like esterase
MTAAAFLVFELFIRAIAFFHPIYDVEMMKYAKALKVNSPVPTLIRQHRPNSKAQLMGVDVALNSMGHRNRELINPKPPNERRIHFVGGSILMAWGVEEEKGMVALVEKRLNKEKSPKTGQTYVGINSGIGNFNTYYEVELFESQVEQTNPDLVVLQYYVNDSEPNPADRDNPIFMDSVALALTYLRLKAAMTTGNTTLEEYYGALYKDGRPDWERTKAAFRKLKKICDERDVPLVVLLVPEVHNFSVESPYRKIYGILDSLFKDLNIPFINPVDALLKAFGPHPTETSVARDDPHPNGPAHKVMADQLSDYLLALDF